MLEFSLITNLSTMVKTKNATYPGLKSCYVSPLVELLRVDSSGVLCQSGGNEDFNDQGTVDWFTE